MELQIFRRSAAGVYDLQGRVAVRRLGLHLDICDESSECIACGDVFYVVSRGEGLVAKSGKVMRTGR